MAGMSFFITSQGVLVADGAAAAAALQQRFSSAIASGEVNQHRQIGSFTRIDGNVAWALGYFTA